MARDVESCLKFVTDSSSCQPLPVEPLPPPHTPPPLHARAKLSCTIARCIEVNIPYKCINFQSGDVCKKCMVCYKSVSTFCCMHFVRQLDRRGQWLVVHWLIIHLHTSTLRKFGEVALLDVLL